MGVGLEGSKSFRGMAWSQAWLSRLVWVKGHSGLCVLGLNLLDLRFREMGFVPNISWIVD